MRTHKLGTVHAPWAALIASASLLRLNSFLLSRMLLFNAASSSPAQEPPHGPALDPGEIELQPWTPLEQGPHTKTWERTVQVFEDGASTRLPRDWADLGTVLTGLYLFEDTNAPTIPMRFYRSVSP